MPLREAIVKNAKRVTIGKAGVGGVEDQLFATLGSCVGIVLVWPAEARFVLAHVLMPGDSAPDPVPRSQRTRYATTAVPAMLARLGIPIERARQLRAYIAGGANMLGANDQHIHVGEQNIANVREALRRNRIRLFGEDVGGRHGRQLIVEGARHRVTSVILSEKESLTTWTVAMQAQRKALA